jgi:hypothetical protein
MLEKKSSEILVLCSTALNGKFQTSLDTEASEASVYYVTAVL